MFATPLTAALLGFLIAVLGTWALVRFAPQLRLVDLPNERSSHVRPTPRGGGLAVVIAITVSCLAVPGPLPMAVAPALWAALPIAAVGLIDDRHGLSARVRLACHLAAALACVLALAAPIEPAWPRALLVAVSVLAIAWGTNLFNFMDGIDGIAAMEAIFVAGAGALLLAGNAPPVAAALWVIVAACAGFLIWNWAPARIFMGDVGSGFFGFLLAAIAVLTVLQGLMSLPVWLILWGTFIADTGVTLARRVLRGERWWSAHRSHAYQHLSRRLGSHARSTLVYAAINVVVIAPLGWFARERPDLAWPVCGITLLALVVAAGAARAGVDEAPVAAGSSAR